jgi:ubiquinone/menaquinone biosynthesis C-methylase UbiE
MNDDPIRAAWHGSGQYWDRFAPVIAQFFKPLAIALVETTGIRSGDRALDLAGGTGDMALELSSRGARVTCSDVSWPMIAAARRRTFGVGPPAIDALQCDACNLPFDRAMFDVAVSRLGVMFFPDPPQAVREILRVLRPGGRVAFAVWANRDDNPFFGAITDLISRYVPSEPEPPDVSKRGVTSAAIPVRRL